MLARDVANHGLELLDALRLGIGSCEDRALDMSANKKRMIADID
jgi:hypothetical protein